MQGRTTSGPTGRIGGAAARVAAAARALAVVAEVVGAGCIRIRPRGAGMSSRRMGSLGSLVDRLHVSLAWPEAAGIFAVASFFSKSQPDWTNEAEPHGKSLPQ